MTLSDSNQQLGIIARLIEELGKLPGIGPKSAERLAHYILTADKKQVLSLAECLRSVKESIKQCKILFASLYLENFYSSSLFRQSDILKIFDFSSSPQNFMYFLREISQKMHEI